MSQDRGTSGEVVPRVCRTCRVRASTAPTSPAGDSEALGSEKQAHGVCSDLCLEASRPPAPDVTGSPAPSVCCDCPGMKAVTRGHSEMFLVAGIMPVCLLRIKNYTRGRSTVLFRAGLRFYPLTAAGQPPSASPAQDAPAFRSNSGAKATPGGKS